MKKLILTLATICALSFALPAFAADIEILVDDNRLKSAAEFGELEEGEERFCLDVQPVVQNQRVYVPLRLLAELLGFEVDWSGEEVTLAQGENTVVLSWGEAVVKHNGTVERLEAPLFTQQNRVMVPLRYIAEWFGCNVDYTDGQVQITTADDMFDNNLAELYVKGSMTVGSKLYIYRGDLLLNNMYALLNAREHEVDEPEQHGFLADITGYRDDGEYKFVDAAGNVLMDITVYAIKFFPPNPPSGYTAQLI